MIFWALASSTCASVGLQKLKANSVIAHKEPALLFMLIRYAKVSAQMLRAQAMA